MENTIESSVRTCFRSVLNFIQDYSYSGIAA